MGSKWVVSIDVEDTDATTETAVAAGAGVQMTPEDTPFGRISQLSDPTGATFQLHSHRLTHPGPAEHLDTEL